MDDKVGMLRWESGGGVGIPCFSNKNIMLPRTGNYIKSPHLSFEGKKKRYIKATFGGNFAGLQTWTKNSKSLIRSFHSRFEWVGKHLLCDKHS